MQVSGSRIVAGSLAGSIVLLAWGMVWWAALSPMIEPIGSLPPAAETLVVDALLDERVAEGAYFIPAMPEEMTTEAREAWAAKQRSGPLGLFLYHPDGVTPGDPVFFVRGFVINLAACLLAILLILPGVRAGWSFPKKAAAFVGVGLIASLVSYGNLWNWMHAPTGFTWKMSADIVGGWLLAGVAVAAIVKATPGTLTAKVELREA